MALLVRDIHALEAVDVPGEAALADVGLAALDGLGQRVVDEDVLLLRLDEVVPLPSDVLQVRENVDVAPGRDLTHHGVQDDVTARSAYARTAVTKKDGCRARPDMLKTIKLKLVEYFLGNQMQEFPVFLAVASKEYKLPLRKPHLAYFWGLIS